jgi:dephospho-CoA kinase
LQEWLSESDRSKARLQEVGWDVMASGRQRELNAQLISRLSTAHSAVIDGFRHPIDFECMSHAFGSSFALIFVQANRSLRLQRTLSRFDSGTRFDESEQQPVESFIDHLLPLSSATVVNEGSLGYLCAQLDSVIERLFAKAAA